MENLRTFEEFKFNPKIFGWVKDIGLVKRLYDVYNLVKDVFDGSNYEEVCSVLNDKFNTNLDPVTLQTLTVKISRNNNQIVTEGSVAKGGILSLIIGLVIAFCVMYPVFKISQKQYIDNRDYIESIEMKGYDSVKYIEYQFMGPLVPSPRGSGFGVGVYSGIRNGEKYIIYGKAMGSSDLVIIDKKPVKK
jgi:hypothetical protein